MLQIMCVYSGIYESIIVRIHCLMHLGLVGMFIHRVHLIVNMAEVVHTLDTFQSCTEPSINKIDFFFLSQLTGHRKYEAEGAKQKRLEMGNRLWEAAYAASDHPAPFFGISFPDDDGLVPHLQTMSAICRSNTI